MEQANSKSFRCPVAVSIVVDFPNLILASLRLQFALHIKYYSIN